VSARTIVSFAVRLYTAAESTRVKYNYREDLSLFSETIWLWATFPASRHQSFRCTEWRNYHTNASNARV